MNESSSIYDYFGTGLPHTVFTAGTEYEVEHVGSHSHVGHPFTIENDGSLRNNGYEYITCPLGFDESLNAFKELFATIEYNSALGHGERTSTHVHINVGGLSMQQCKQLVLLYSALEPLFFAYVAPHRQDNIFCVPLSYTTLSKQYSQNFRDWPESWHKYTAFNLLPLREHGTIEFRHLQGTCNFDLYKGWLTSLKNLFEFIRDNGEFDIIKYLYKGGSVQELTKILPILKEKVDTNNLTTLLYDSTLDVKLAVGSV